MQKNYEDREKVAKQAFVLAALVCRGFIDEDLPSDVEAVYARIIPWLEEMDAMEMLEGDEKEALEARLGSLKSQMKLNLIWTVEGLAILAWALGRYELHEHSEVADAQAITQRLFFLSSKAKELYAGEVLEKEQIEACYHDSLEVLKRTHKIVQNPQLFTEEMSAQNSIALERVRALQWLLSTDRYASVKIALD